MRIRSIVAFAIAILTLPAQAAIPTGHAGDIPTLLLDPHNVNTPFESFPLSYLDPNLKPPRSETPTAISDQRWHDLRQKILNDFANRMSADFSIPESLRRRVAFWFDIYTRYDQGHHIIHDVRYPWIVFRVVDTSSILLNGKGPLWMRRQKSQRLAYQEANRIRLTLRHMAHMRSYRHMTAMEKHLYDLLVPLKGSRHHVFWEASHSVRIQLGQKDFFQAGLVTSSRYLSYMEAEFKRLGLPVELTRMPFVESSFNDKARSKVGASGIWQIMPRTGKAYMIVNHNIDERNSPLKATVTAAHLLRQYHHALHSWPLAITAYNHGIGNIRKAIRAARTHDLAKIIIRYHRGDFRFASSNFFTCFLAALYAEKYHELIFKDRPRDPLQAQRAIKLTGRTRARYLEKITGMSSSQILDYNPDLRSAIRHNSYLPRGYELFLPPATEARVIKRRGIKVVLVGQERNS